MKSSSRSVFETSCFLFHLEKWWSLSTIWIWEATNELPSMSGKFCFREVGKERPFGRSRTLSLDSFCSWFYWLMFQKQHVVQQDRKEIVLPPGCRGRLFLAFDPSCCDSPGILRLVAKSPVALLCHHVTVSMCLLFFLIRTFVIGFRVHRNPRLSHLKILI